MREILFVAGEASGDSHGAGVARELAARGAPYKLVGVGGDQMRAAGVELIEHTGKLAVLLSMDKVKMRNPVVPGDQLILEATAVRVKSRTGHVRCKAFVHDKLACEADIKFMLVDAEPV